MIDDQLLIASPTLQDVLVDKLGIALASGVVKCFQDGARTTFKNWYYQSGSPNNYTYIALPNPMTLSAAGTIVDVNGNDTIPFFYPYDPENNNAFQPYFIEVYDKDGQLQFTRQNFPFVANEAPGPEPIIINPTLQNVIINNRFWRNIGSIVPSSTTMGTWTTQYNNSGTVYYATLAPSQHDGFSMPDLNYIKTNNSATETISFASFAQSDTPILVGDITPEFYINHNCSGAGSSETLKVYQIPISLSTQSLVSVQASVTIQAINFAGAANGTLQLFYYQFLGTGAASPNPVLINNVTIELTPDWEKYNFTFTLPPTEGLTLSTTGDDALYLQIGMPLNNTCNIGFTVPSIYLSDSVPSNDFATYDQIDAVINTPRTGDLRTSLNSFYPFGWVPMNNGTIGWNSTLPAPTYVPTARNNQDTWPLYYLLWTAFKPYDSGGLNPIAQMYTTGASTATTGYGSSAYADFIAFKAINLTKSMGQILMGTVPISALLAATPTISGYASIVTASSSSGLLLTTAASNLLSYFNGMPVIFTNTGGGLPGNLVANTVYYVAGFNGSTTFHVGTSFANAMAGTYVAYSSAGTGTTTVDVAPAGSYEGEYAHTQLATELVSHTHGPLSPATNFLTNTAGAAASFTASPGTLTLSATTAAFGGGLAFNVTQPGTLTNIYIKL